MTTGELKFALHVETVLNTIPQPEYRQLMVEAMMVLAVLVDHKVVKRIDEIINVEQVVHAANKIFLDEQVSLRTVSNGSSPLSSFDCENSLSLCRRVAKLKQQRKCQRSKSRGKRAYVRCLLPN